MWNYGSRNMYKELRTVEESLIYMGNAQGMQTNNCYLGKTTWQVDRHSTPFLIPSLLELGFGPVP
jgi:hypothetical protein